MTLDEEIVGRPAPGFAGRGGRRTPVGALRDGGGQLIRLYRSRALSTGLVPHLAFFALPVGQRVGSFQLEGYPFFARGTDWRGVENVALRREFEFILPLLAGGRPVVVDVGANIGMFSLYAFLANRDAIVHALEPSPDTFDLLRRNSRANPGLAWSCYHAAVHAGDGVVYVDDQADSTARRVCPREGDEVPSFSLRTLLTRYVESRVRLLKITVEGSEEAVLAGNEDLLSRVDHLVVELHPGECRTDRVVAAVLDAFPRLYEVPRRGARKPLLLATRTPVDLPRF